MPLRSSNAVWAGKTVLITAGPTREHLDPIRFLTNASSGRMGAALAAQARRLGAKVLLVLGPCAQVPPEGVTVFPVVTAQEMFRRVMSLRAKADVIIAAAAVSDWRFAASHRHKIKRDAKRLPVVLVPNPDIVKEAAARRRPGQLVAGFALETRAGLAHAKAKLRAKGLDLIVLNGPETLESGRARITILSRAGKVSRLPSLEKKAAAKAILSEIGGLWKR